MLTHVLDTSAWVAHIKDEAGGDKVTTLFNDSETQIGISALSLVEVYGLLKAIGRESEFGDIVEQYRQLFAQIVPIDEKVAFRATELRQKTTSRLPGIDAVIAATAAYHDAILVHRDGHFLSIPDEWVKQRFLAGDEE